jgi:hypothetical protein
MKNPLNGIIDAQDMEGLAQALAAVPHSPGKSLLQDRSK